MRQDRRPGGGPGQQGAGQLQAACRVCRIRGRRQLELPYRIVEVTAADGEAGEHVEKSRLADEPRYSKRIAVMM